MCLPNRCSTTSIIADDNGKLFDCICRGRSSPWGDYATSTMDETCDCCCVQQFRKPDNYCCDVPKKEILIGQKQNKSKKCGARSKKTAEPCPHFTIVLGSPPESQPGRTDKFSGMSPREKMFAEQREKKQKREQKKVAQIQRKYEIDEKEHMRREQLFQHSIKPVKPVDWKTVRKQTWDPDAARIKKKSTGPVCPPLNACCANKIPGQWVTCTCLDDENYIRRF